MIMGEVINFILIISIIVIIGIYIVRSFKVENVKKFELLVRYLAALSVVLVIYNIYINVKSSEKIEKNRIAYNTIKNIEKNYLNPQKELLALYPEGYFLYASMNQDTDLNQTEPKNFDPVKRKQLEVYMSLRVFQAMEDFLSTVRYDITGMYVWINNFIMWMQSPILRQHWNILRFNYSDDTREMVQRIIEKSDELIALRAKKGLLNAEDYDAISKSFPVQPRG